MEKKVLDRRLSLTKKVIVRLNKQQMNSMDVNLFKTRVACTWICPATLQNCATTWEGCG